MKFWKITSPFTKHFGPNLFCYLGTICRTPQNDNVGNRIGTKQAHIWKSWQVSIQCNALDKWRLMVNTPNVKFRSVQKYKRFSNEEI